MVIRDNSRFLVKLRVLIEEVFLRDGVLEHRTGNVGVAQNRRGIPLDVYAGGPAQVRTGEVETTNIGVGEVNSVQIGVPKKSRFGSSPRNATCAEKLSFANARKRVASSTCAGSTIS